MELYILITSRTFCIGGVPTMVILRRKLWRNNGMIKNAPRLTGKVLLIDSWILKFFSTFKYYGAKSCVP